MQVFSPLNVPFASLRLRKKKEQWWLTRHLFTWITFEAAWLRACWSSCCLSWKFSDSVIEERFDWVQCILVKWNRYINTYIYATQICHCRKMTYCTFHISHVWQKSFTWSNFDNFSDIQYSPEYHWMYLSIFFNVECKVFLLGHLNICKLY